MNTPTIQIDEGVILRIPRKEDFEYEYPYGISMHRIFEKLPSAIIDIQQRVRIKPYIFSEKEKLIVALQLYRVGPVYEISSKWHPESLLL